LSDGVDASDVVVVYETRTQIDVLELALRARNVPFLRLASSGFYDQFDVRDVLTIVRAVRNPLDDLAVASALAGPLANLTYGALARVLEQAGVGRGDAARNREGDPQRQSVLEVAASMDDDAARLASHIQRLRTIERTASIVEVIEYIVTQPEIELGAASTELGVQRLANMRQLVALAAEARQVGIGDCARFLEYVDAQRRFRKVGEASIADEATGAIRLMSIHASKGLEFDHVFFVKSDQITRSVPPGKPPTPLLDGDGVLHIPAPSEDGPIRDTGALEQLRAVDQQAHDEERMRKAYVAMTRAKSHLYVSGVHDPVAEHIEEHETTFSLDVDPAGSPLTWIADRMQIDLGSRAIGDELHEQLVVRRGPAGEVTVLAHKHGRVEHALSEQLIAPDQHALLDATNHRLDNDATHALSQALAEAVTQVRDREIRLADGTRIHDALARLMTDAVERGVAFDQLTQEGRTPWLTPRTSARLTPVAASEVFTRLVALHARAEVAWIAPFGAVTTSRSADGIPIVADAQLVDDGRIDVLAVLPDGRWWIVDWKVTLPELAADAWQAHGAQLTRYAVAARQGGAVGAVLSLVDISHPSRVHTWDGSALDVSNVGRRAPAMPMQLSALPAT
jgi:ATP-dependent exoDNAse (exonuclease V) beta subunit